MRDRQLNGELAMSTDRKGGFLCFNPFSSQNPQDEANGILIPALEMEKLKATEAK